MTFEEYLQSKKIDPKLFQSGERDQYMAWEKEFEQLHPDSFTSQKLYLINPLRRRFKLTVEKTSKEKPAIAKTAVSNTATKPSIGKPVMGKSAAGKPVMGPKMGKPVIKKPKTEE